MIFYASTPAPDPTTSSQKQLARALKATRDMSTTEIPSTLPGNLSLADHDPVMFDLIEKEKVGEERAGTNSCNIAIERPKHHSFAGRVWVGPLEICAAQDALTMAISSFLFSRDFGASRPNLTLQQDI